MKVVKLKSGYRISASDGDYEALKAMTDFAEQSHHDEVGLQGSAKSAHTRRTKGGLPFLRVDDDRRGAGAHV